MAELWHSRQYRRQMSMLSCTNQAIVFGHLPLLLEVAGSKVAFAHVSVSARPMKVENCILAIIEVV